MMHRATSILSLLVVAIACAGPIKLYEGPDLPDEQIVTLKQGPQAKVLAVDGEHVNGWSWHLEPGRHTVLILARGVSGGLGATVAISRTCEIEFDAEPGAAYYSKASARDAESSGPVIAITVGELYAHIVNEASGARSTCQAI